MNDQKDQPEASQKPDDPETEAKPGPKAAPELPGEKRIRQGAEQEMSINKSMGRRLQDSMDMVTSQIRTMQIEINTLNAKARTEHDMIKQMLTLFGDVETRLEAFRVLGIRAGMFTAEEYDAMWDEIKGLRVKGPSETIESNDFITMTFIAMCGTHVEMQGKQFPLRLGHSGLMIEEHIVGKAAGSKKIQFDIIYPAEFKPRPDLAGKRLSFNIDIDKVKTKKKGIPDVGSGKGTAGTIN